jgi:hypothetical protein
VQAGSVVEITLLKVVGDVTTASGTNVSPPVITGYSTSLPISNAIKL